MELGALSLKRWFRASTIHSFLGPPGKAMSVFTSSRGTNSSCVEWTAARGTEPSRGT